MGAEICCVRAELPALLPLPRLFLSLIVVPPGDSRPPDINALAPPMRAGLPDCLISDGLMSEFDRRWFCLRFLYLRAIKNMAAPYAAEPPMAAIAIPTVVPLTEEDWFSSLLLNRPLFPAPVLDDGDEPLPLPVEDPSKVAPGVIGIAGLM